MAEHDKAEQIKKLNYQSNSVLHQGINFSVGQKKFGYWVLPKASKPTGGPDYLQPQSNEVKKALWSFPGCSGINEFDH